MRTFLAGVPMQGAKVVIVGGDEPALAKLRLFLTTPADLVWIAPEAAPDPAAAPRRAPPPQVRAVAPEDFAGARLVFIAVSQDEEAARLAALARAAGAQVNVVDRPALSDFQTPALIDRDELVVGIATGGGAPILARDLRSRLEGELPAALGPLAALGRSLRDQAKAAIPDGLIRRRFWERAFRGTAADLVADNRMDEARDEMVRLMHDAGPQAGSVALVGAGPGDPELLTLKAVRVLRDADLLVHGADLGDAVLERARRDAPRVALDAAQPDFHTAIVALMTEHAMAGQRVVRLFRGDPGDVGAREKAALQAAGVTVLVVPGLVVQGLT